MNYNSLTDSSLIKRIDVSFGSIKKLPILPLNLEILFADDNPDLELDPICPTILPSTLRILSICLTGITIIGDWLPDNLEELYISDNPGIILPSKLPTSLSTFVSNSCELEEFTTELPPCLLVLSLDGNFLQNINSTLPDSLHTLVLSNNVLEKLPSLPSSLQKLIINNNKLEFLPNIPDCITYLNCAENTIKRFPTLPDILEQSHSRFIWFGNPLVYEFHNKRFGIVEYINRTNSFVKLVCRIRIRALIQNYLDHLIDRKRIIDPYNTCVKSKSYNSSLSSFSCYSCTSTISAASSYVEMDNLDIFEDIDDYLMV